MAINTEEQEMIDEMIASGDLIADEEISICPNCGDGMYIASNGGCAHCGWIA